jgi:hypothetical protein
VRTRLFTRQLTLGLPARGREGYQRRLDGRVGRRERRLDHAHLAVQLLDLAANLGDLGLHLVEHHARRIERVLAPRQLLALSDEHRQRELRRA